MAATRAYRASMSWFVPFIVAIYAIVGSLLVSVAPALDVLRPNDLALVVKTPGQNGDALVAAAGGRPIGPYQTDRLVFATSKEPTFSGALYAKGAILVLNATWLAQFCGVEA